MMARRRCVRPRAKRCPFLFALLLVVPACGVTEAPRSQGTPSPSSDGPAEDTAAVSPPGQTTDGSAPDTGSASEIGPTSGGAGAGGSGLDGAAPDSVAPPVVVPDGAVPDGVLPSGVRVSIAGMSVPKEKAIVFLHIGHSNMAGRATGPADLHDFEFTTNPHLWAYAKGGVWRPAVEPLSPDSMTLPGMAGPGMSILRTALAMAPDLYMISIGHGHSGDTGGYCRNFRKGGLFYDIVMGPALELKGKVTFGAIFVMHGIAELKDKVNVGTFDQCMEGLASDMRGDLQEPNLPFLVGDWEAGATGLSFSPTLPFPMEVMAKLRTAVAIIPRSKLIPTDMVPMEDDHHYNFAGHKLWAERGFSLMKQAGWTPWATQ
jgi:hypothetical protein